MQINEIIQGEAITTLATLPAASVDVVFADPPYNLQLQGELWRPNMTRVDAVNDAWDQFATFDEYDAFTRAWLSETRRVMQERGTIWVSGTYHNIFRVGALMQDLGFWVLNVVTWHKSNAMPNFRGTRLKNDVEFVIWAKKSAKSRYTFNHHPMKQFNNGKQLGSVWQIPICGGDERLKDASGHKLHSTQKPEALLMRILLASSTPGDLVLDPFMGTGTTGAVAQRLRRRWIGIERDAAYVAAARQRIARVVPLAADDPLLVQAEQRPRIPFKQLLERGYLQAGDRLYLDSPSCEGTVEDNGKVRSGDHHGTIHRLAALLKGVPSCNGWAHWQYRDDDGQLLPLNHLRERIRAEEQG